MSDKAAGYVRVSTEKQKQEGSHLTQREKIRSWAEDHNYDIDIFEDIAISGKSDEREAYDRMMNNIDDYDAVIVRELSRFGRSLKKVLDDIEELEKKQVDFISIKESLDTTTAQGKLFFHIVAAFNQYWADLAKERTEEMIEQRRKDGKPIGRPRKLNEEQMEKVFELHEAGLSYSDIAKFVKTEYGFDTLHRSTIKRYIDDYEENKEA